MTTYNNCAFYSSLFRYLVCKHTFVFVVKFLFKEKFKCFSTKCRHCKIVVKCSKIAVFAHLLKCT